jgi:hypothetical protein
MLIAESGPLGAPSRLPMTRSHVAVSEDSQNRPPNRQQKKPGRNPSGWTEAKSACAAQSGADSVSQGDRRLPGPERQPAQQHRSGVLRRRREDRRIDGRQRARRGDDMEAQGCPARRDRPISPRANVARPLPMRFHLRHIAVKVVRWRPEETRRALLRPLLEAP